MTASEQILNNIAAEQNEELGTLEQEIAALKNVPAHKVPGTNEYIRIGVLRIKRDRIEKKLKASGHW